MSEHIRIFSYNESSLRLYERVCFNTYSLKALGMESGFSPLHSLVRSEDLGKLPFSEEVSV